MREERGFIHKGLSCDNTFPDGSPAFETLLEYSDGSKWLYRNWEGVGPEIGANSLDHEGDVDEGVRVDELAPGETMMLNTMSYEQRTCI